MPEYVGTLPLVEPTPWLLLLPLLSLLAALAALTLAQRAATAESAGGGGGTEPPGWLFAAPALGSLGLLGALCVKLARLPAPFRMFYTEGWTLFRLGSLEASCDLTLDGLSSLFVLGLLLLSLMAQAQAVRAPLAPSRRLLAGAAIHGLSAALLLLCLGDGWVPMLLGWGLSGALLALALRGPRPLGPLALRALGDGLMLVGAGLFLWSLGGGFSSDGFTLDARPRVAVVQPDKPRPKLPVDDDDDDRPSARPGADRRPGEREPEAGRGAKKGSSTVKRETFGSLTLLGLPGARVYLDNNAAPFAVAPFSRRALVTGVHSARVAPGDGADEVEVKNFRVFEDEAVELGVVGASANFRQAAALLRLRDATGPLPPRERISRPQFAGGSIAFWASLLVALGALTRATAVGEASESEAPGAGAIGAAALLTAVYPLARLVSLLVASEPAQAVLVVVGAGGALTAAARVLRSPDPRRVALLAVGAQAGVAVVALGAGSVEAAAFHAVVTALGAGLFLQAAGPVRLPASLGAAALAALPPAAGFFSLVEVMRAVGASALSAPLAALGLAAITLAQAPLAFAVFRLLHAESRAAPAALAGAAHPAPRPRRSKGAKGAKGAKRASQGEVPAAPAGPAQAAAAAPAPLVVAGGGGTARAMVTALAVLLAAAGPLGASWLFDAPIGAWLRSAYVPASAAAAALPPSAALFAALIAALCSAVAWSQARGRPLPARPPEARGEGGALRVADRASAALAVVERLVDGAFELPARALGSSRGDERKA